MSSGRQAEAVPSARAERKRIRREEFGVVIYAIVVAAVMVSVLGVIFLTVPH